MTRSKKHVLKRVVKTLDQTTRRIVFSRSNLVRRYVANTRLASFFQSDQPGSAINAMAPDLPNTWAISRKHAQFLARLVVNLRPQHVLEFGAGASSLVLARALASIGGGQLTSVEQSPEWCAELWSQVRRVQRVDAQLIVASPRFRIGPAGVYFSYPTAADTIAERGPYDLVFIDAPQSFYGRDGALHSAYAQLQPNAVVILDDARRGSERWTLYRWLQIYPGLTLAVFDPDFAKRGVAILQHTGDKTRRVRASAIITSAVFALYAWVTRGYRMLRRTTRPAV